MKTLLILAGGFGSRLKSVVSEVPKPLAPVCGQPFLKYIIENCVSQGIDDLVFLLFYEAQKIQDMLDEMTEAGYFRGIQVRVVLENKPKGTGGAILNAINELNIHDSFLVTNADTWLGTGIEQISNTSAPSIALVEVKNSSRYGSVMINNRVVVKFSEKNISNGESLINAGLYHLSPENFRGISPDSSFSLEQEILPKLVDLKSLTGMVLNTSFIDIGVPEDYFKFCKWVEQGENFEF